MVHLLKRWWCSYLVIFRSAKLSDFQQLSTSVPTSGGTSTCNLTSAEIWFRAKRNTYLICLLDARIQPRAGWILATVWSVSEHLVSSPARFVLLQHEAFSPNGFTRSAWHNITFKEKHRDIWLRAATALPPNGAESNVTGTISRIWMPEDLRWYRNSNSN